MSLKLRMAAIWTPKRTLRMMLARVDAATTAALDRLLAECGAGPVSQESNERAKDRGIDASRAAMASGHNARVNALVDAVGRARAVELGRQALYPVGVRLGREAKDGLSAGDGPKDLERAARILYRALGINFKLEMKDDGTMLLRVDRCALAHHYSEEACMVLSAGDEGVVAGLNPNFAMRFEQRMTGGSAVCIACIREEKK